MQVFDLFNNDHERRLAEGAVDQLEQRRIDDLAMKMDDLVKRAKEVKDPAHKAALVREFQKCKAERDSYYKVRTNEGSMKHQMHKDAERMTREQFVERYGDENGEFWDNIMGYEDEENLDIDLDGGLSAYNELEEAGIGQDLVNKTEKLARATPPSKAGAVASTVKNAAKWLAGKGGPSREGPTYEGAEDIVDRGEYDREGDMAKDNIHTIVRNAQELERILGDNDNLPEWVQDKLANVKGMMTAVSEYMQTQHERDHEEGVAIPEAKDDAWQKETPWTKTPKAKSGRPVDPRGEVTHLSDVARREAERKAQGQKKNSKEVEEGWSDAIVAQRTGRPRTPYSVFIKGKEWKSFADDDHAQNVADKLRAKFEREGKDPSVITIAATGSVDEASSPAQQAAIAIAKKKAHKKPKQVDEISFDLTPFEAGYADGESGEYYENPYPENSDNYYEFRKGWRAAQAEAEHDKSPVFKSHRIKVVYPEGKGKSHNYTRNEPYKLATIISDANSIAHRNPGAEIELSIENKFVPNYEWQDGVEMGSQGIKENLRDWFGKEKWVRMDTRGNIKGDCARGSSSEGKPKCLPQARAHALGKKGRAAAAQKKRRQDPDAERRGKAINVATKVKENVTDVKAGMAEIYRRLAPKIEHYKDSFLAGQLYDELENYAELHGAEKEFKQIMSTARGRAHMEYDTNPGGFHNWFWFLPFEDNVAEAELDEACWKGYHKEGNKKMFGKRYPNCVKNKNEDVAEGSSSVSDNDVADLIHDIAVDLIFNKQKMSIRDTDPTLIAKEVKKAYNMESIPFTQNELDHVLSIFPKVMSRLRKGFSESQQGVAEGFNLERIGHAECPVCHNNDLDWDEDTQTVGCRGCGSEFEANGKQIKEQGVAEGIPFDQCPKCGGTIVHESQLAEKQDACYHKVKSRYKVWPSAYASGALVQCRKKGAANWGNGGKNESAEQELDEKWTKKYKSSINCSNPKGFSQKAHCAGRNKNESVAESYTEVMESQGITDAKLLAVARRIDSFAKDLK